MLWLINLIDYLGIILSDIDECTDGTNDCDENASCDNEPGTFVCTCNTGFRGDGKQCIGKQINITET